MRLAGGGWHGRALPLQTAMAMANAAPALYHATRRARMAFTT
jgi:hypothetical protein